MRTHNFKKDIDCRLFYGLVIVMALLLTTIVYDAFGSGPTCSSPCAIYSFDYCTGSWGCQGCDSCSHCNTSTATCVYDCRPICMDCNSIANPSGCGGIITGCTSYLCSPEKCETCDGHGLCKVCGGDPNKACCNGTCYDTRTQKCCDEFSPPHICEKNHECCNGTCCEYPKCCDNGVCKGPICDNCKSLNMVFNECGHGPGDTICQSYYCIKNIVDTVTCDYHPDNHCPSKCATVISTGAAITQDVFTISSNDCSCAGDPVNYHDMVQQYYGCTFCYEWPVQAACDTSGCTGTYYNTEYKGEYRLCGFWGSCP